MEFFTNPWVIGIGTGVIVGLILYFVLGIGKHKSRPGQLTTQLTTTIQEKNHSTPPPVPAQDAMSNITLKNIKKYLDSLPPLQRDSAADNYKGIKVSWKVNLHGVSTLPDRKLRLHMYHRGDLFSFQINCTVEDPNQYPLLRVINKTQLFTVEGEIEKITPISIALKNCQFIF